MTGLDGILDDGAVARVTYLEHDGDGVHSVVTPSGTGYGFLPDESTESRAVTVESRRDALYFEEHPDYGVTWLDSEEGEA